MVKIAVTGHRPPRIRGQEQEIKNWLKELLMNLKACYKDVILLDGMAQGVDQIAATIAFSQGIPLKCYFAYKHDLNKAEQEFAEIAEEIDWGYDEYPGKHAYLDRDRRMVEDCDILLAVWDGVESGGTYYTYNYAQELGKKVFRFHPWRLR